MKIPPRKKIIVPCVTPGCNGMVWRASPEVCDECTWKLYLNVILEFGLAMPEQRPDWIGQPAPPLPDHVWW